MITMASITCKNIRTGKRKHKTLRYVVIRQFRVTGLRCRNVVADIPMVETYI
jgi:hypothetical protein